MGGVLKFACLRGLLRRYSSEDKWQENRAANKHKQYKITADRNNKRTRVIRTALKRAHATTGTNDYAQQKNCQLERYKPKNKSAMQIASKKKWRTSEAQKTCNYALDANEYKHIVAETSTYKNKHR